MAPRIADKMRDLTPGEIQVTAYHEAGHAVVGLVLIPGLVRDVSINERVLCVSNGNKRDQRNYLGQMRFLAYSTSDSNIERLGICYTAGKLGELIGLGAAEAQADRFDSEFLFLLAANHTRLSPLYVDSQKYVTAWLEFHRVAESWARVILQTEARLFRELASELRHIKQLNRARLLALLDKFGTGQLYNPVLFAS